MTVAVLISAPWHFGRSVRIVDYDWIPSVPAFLPINKTDSPDV